eukprot:3746632-Prymnesium_polylepis.2
MRGGVRRSLLVGTVRSRRCMGRVSGEGGRERGPTLPSGRTSTSQHDVCAWRFDFCPRVRRGAVCARRWDPAAAGCMYSSTARARVTAVTGAPGGTHPRGGSTP